MAYKKCRGCGGSGTVMPPIGVTDRAYDICPTCVGTGTEPDWAGGGGGGGGARVSSPREKWTTINWIIFIVMFALCFGWFQKETQLEGLWLWITSGIVAAIVATFWKGLVIGTIVVAGLYAYSQGQGS